MSLPPGYPQNEEEYPKSECPPPCIMKDTPEEQASNMARSFIQNVYGALDSGAQAHIPFRDESIACFQKGSADRFQGKQGITQRLQTLKQGQARDLSLATTQIFPGNSMMTFVPGTYKTQASIQKSTQQQMDIPHRFADFFLICSDAQGPHVRCAVFREIDEDSGAPPAGAAQGPQFQQADQLAQNFVNFLYDNLDDPARRKELTNLFRETSVMTVGNQMFKGVHHIAHRLHFMPQQRQPRQKEGFEAIPSPAGGVFLYFYGTMLLQEQEHPQRFFDVAHLMPEGNSFWVTNLMLNVHGGM